MPDFGKVPGSIRSPAPLHQATNTTAGTHLSPRAHEALKLSHWNFYGNNPAVCLDTKGEVPFPATPLANVLLKTNNWNQA